MPLRPSSRSPLELLDRRSDELALPWARLEMREKELIREQNRGRRLTQNVTRGTSSRSCNPDIGPPRPVAHGGGSLLDELTHVPPHPWCVQCVKGMSSQSGDVRTCVPAAGKTVTDYLVESGKRSVEQYFRRRVRSRCDGEPTTSASGASLPTHKSEQNNTKS